MTGLLTPVCSSPTEDDDYGTAQIKTNIGTRDKIKLTFSKCDACGHYFVKGTNSALGTDHKCVNTEGKLAPLHLQQNTKDETLSSQRVENPINDQAPPKSAPHVLFKCEKYGEVFNENSSISSIADHKYGGAERQTGAGESGVVLWIVNKCDKCGHRFSEEATLESFVQHRCPNSPKPLRKWTEEQAIMAVVCDGCGLVFSAQSHDSRSEEPDAPLCPQCSSPFQFPHSGVRDVWWNGNASPPQNTTTGSEMFVSGTGSHVAQPEEQPEGAIWETPSECDVSLGLIELNSDAELKDQSFMDSSPEKAPVVASGHTSGDDSGSVDTLNQDKREDSHASTVTLKDPALQASWSSTSGSKLVEKQVTRPSRSNASPLAAEGPSRTPRASGSRSAHPDPRPLWQPWIASAPESRTQPAESACSSLKRGVHESSPHTKLDASNDVDMAHDDRSRALVDTHPVATGKQPEENHPVSDSQMGVARTRHRPETRRPVPRATAVENWTEPIRLMQEHVQKNTGGFPYPAAWNHALGWRNFYVSSSVQFSNFSQTGFTWIPVRRSLFEMFPIQTRTARPSAPETGSRNEATGPSFRVGQGPKVKQSCDATQIHPNPSVSTRKMNKENCTEKSDKVVREITAETPRQDKYRKYRKVSLDSIVEKLFLVKFGESPTKPHPKGTGSTDIDSEPRVDGTAKNSASECNSWNCQDDQAHQVQERQKGVKDKPP